MSLVKYVKTAFLNHWNLLFFLGALGFSALSGRADVLAPLVLASEVAYLGLLGTHPRFQSYVDAQEAKAARQPESASVEQSLRRILAALPARSLKRFEAVRSRCLGLRQLALEIKDPGRAGEPLPLESIQLEGLDRLLWIFLKLLFTQHSLERFLESTSEKEIQAEITRLQSRLKGLHAAAEASQEEKMRKALEDNLQTCQARLENIQKARDKSELVTIELDRLENKIHSLGEIAVNRHEPDFISAQVDQVASSLLSTERTMSELQFATGIDLAGESAPELLRRETTEMKE